MSKRILLGTSIALLAFIALAIVTTTGQLAPFDKTVSAAVHAGETPALTAILLVITNAGAWFVYVPITLVLLAIPRLRFKLGLPIAATLAAAGALNWALKLLFAVPRPEAHRLIIEPGFSFPSGHAMSAAAFIGIAVLLFMRYLPKGRHGVALKTLVSILALLFVLAVGLSRVYLGVHNPSDIMAGYAMGLALCLLSLGVVDAIERRAAVSHKGRER
jgi:undecaprenyl-diphosphatase